MNSIETESSSSVQKFNPISPTNFNNNNNNNGITIITTTSPSPSSPHSSSVTTPITKNNSITSTATTTPPRNNSSSSTPSSDYNYSTPPNNNNNNNNNKLEQQSFNNGIGVTPTLNIEQIVVNKQQQQPPLLVVDETTIMNSTSNELLNQQDLGNNNNSQSRSSSTHSHHSNAPSSSAPPPSIYNEIDIVKVVQFFENFDSSSLDEDNWKELLLNCFAPSSQQLSFKKKRGNRKYSKQNETNQEMGEKSIILDNTSQVLSSKGGALMDLSGLHHISIHSLYRLKQLLYFRFFFFTTQAVKLSGNESTTLIVNNSLNIARNSIRLNRNSTRFTGLSNNQSNNGSPSGNGSGSPLIREVEVMSRKEFTSMKEDILDTWKQFKFTTEPSLKLLWIKYLLNIKFNSIQKCTLMHLASKYNQSMIIEWLVDECGPDFLFVTDAMKMTPLFYTSFFNATESCVFLCTKIKSSSASLRGGATSSTSGTPTTRGRGGSEFSSNGSTPQQQGSYGGRRSIFGNRNSRTDSPPSSPSGTGGSAGSGSGGRINSPSNFNNNSNALERIIQQVDDEFGYNVVYVALKRGCFAVCDMLILFGASLDTTIRGGETMLHRACFELPLDRIIYLIQKGAILLKKDQKGCVPLFNLIGREIEQQQQPIPSTQPSPRRTAISRQSSMKDHHDEKTDESETTTNTTATNTTNDDDRRESKPIIDEDIQLIEEFLLEHEMSSTKDNDNTTTTTATSVSATNTSNITSTNDSTNTTTRTMKIDMTIPTSHDDTIGSSLSNQAAHSPTTSSDGSDSTTTSGGDNDIDSVGGVDIFQELDEMFVDESGEVNYQNKNKLLTNDKRRKREPLKLPAALKMRSDSLAALSGINGMSAATTTPQQAVLLGGVVSGGASGNGGGIMLEDSIKVKSTSSSSSTLNNQVGVKTAATSAATSNNANGSRFPNHISHCLQDEFSLKKNIMFKAMELLVPQMGWSTKTLILSAKKFYGLSEQEARDLFYNDPSERAKKINASTTTTATTSTTTATTDPQQQQNNSSNSQQPQQQILVTPRSLVSPRSSLSDNNNNNTNTSTGMLKRKQPILEAVLPYISREQFIKVLKNQNYHGRNILHDCVIKGDLKSMQLIVSELLQPKKSTLGSALKLASKNIVVVDLTPEMKIAEKQKYDEESQENMQVLNDLLMETDNDKHQTCLAYACAESNTFAVRYLLSLYNIVQMNKRAVANSIANLSNNQQSTTSSSSSGGLLSMTPRGDNSRSTSTLPSPRPVEPKQNLLYKVLHMKNKQGKTPLDISKSSHVPCDDIIELLTQSIEKSGSSSDGVSSPFQFFKRRKK